MALFQMPRIKPKWIWSCRGPVLERLVNKIEFRQKPE